MRSKRSRGISLVEVIVVVAIFGIISLGLVRFFGTSSTYLKRTYIRQQSQLQARSCMDLIIVMLAKGKAPSLVISTPAGTTVPNSRVDFVFQTPLVSGATAYAIYLNSSIVYAQEYGPGFTRSPKPLASNVTGLMFTDDSADPTLVSVTLRLDYAWDSTNTRTSMLLMPSRTVHLVDAP